MWVAEEETMMVSKPVQWSVQQWGWLVWLEYFISGLLYIGWRSRTIFLEYSINLCPLMLAPKAKPSISLIFTFHFQNSHFFHRQENTTFCHRDWPEIFLARWRSPRARKFRGSEEVTESVFCLWKIQFS